MKTMMKVILVIVVVIVVVVVVVVRGIPQTSNTHLESLGSL